MGALEHLVEQIEARRRATSQLVLRFSLPSETRSIILSQLTDKHDCSLSSSARSKDTTPTDGRTDVVALCPRAKLYNVVKFLKSSGAAEIVVNRGEFIFEGFSQAFNQFKQMLKRRDGAATTRALTDG